MKKRFLGPLLLLLIMGLVGFFWFKEGLLPVDSSDMQPAVFVVNKGESVNVIANNLDSQDFIRNRMVFFLVVKGLGIERSIQAGDFRLYRNMGAVEIAKALTHGSLDKWVTIIEGWRKEEVAQAFSQSHSIPEIVFIEKAREGYLFPDTYLIPTAADVDTVLSILEKNFETKVTPDMIAQAKAKGYTLDELLTFASLVEREGRTFGVKKKIAGVIENRLKEGMKLDLDATVQYVLGYSIIDKTWWRNVLIDDLKVVSPYNTYRNAGLPPGPICSPGLDSIQAVLEAEDVPYFYYLTDPQGRMHYGVTIEEHEANKRFL